MLHEDEWVDLVDMPTTTPILTAIFGSPNYILIGAGGDVAMPGAIEYQGLHSDNVWTEPHDPTGRVSTREMPVPAVTINFPMVRPHGARTDRHGRSPARRTRERRSPTSPTSRSG